MCLWLYSILVDGKDASKINLREVEDSPAEWRKRGKNLLENKLYGGSFMPQGLLQAAPYTFMHLYHAAHTRIDEQQKSE